MADSVPISASFWLADLLEERGRRPEIGYFGDANRLPRREEKDKPAAKGL